MGLAEQLSNYCVGNKITTKGPLAVVLFVTRKAKQVGLPLDSTSMKAESAGQVAGLSKGAIQSILAEYGVTRTLAAEGGRTSRGSMKNMEDYVAFLNDLYISGEADLDVIETWWVEKIKAFFSSKPLNLHLDQGMSINAIVRDLLGQAEKRQHENPGTMYAGAMLQHLVGAKLQVLNGTSQPMEHHGFSVADAPTGRSGDFFVGNTIIHVTTAPGELLMEKCVRNIQAGYRPFIVTVANRIVAARQLAEMKDIAQKVEIVDVEQFISTNVYEWSGFDSAKQKDTIENLLSIYNGLIDTYETDPSLKVNLS
jgi:hypothetical protein